VSACVSICVRVSLSVNRYNNKTLHPQWGGRRSDKKEVKEKILKLIYLLGNNRTSYNVICTAVLYK